jgi:hypothetical protein
MDRSQGRTTSVEVEENTTNSATQPDKKSKPGAPGKPGGRSVEISVKPLQLERVKLTLVGITPLIVNHFNNKGPGLIDMRNKQMGIPPPKQRAPKDPVRCFRDSLYSFKPVKVKGTIKDFLAGRPVTAKGDFYLPFGMLKGSIETAALAIDGASKAAVQRCVRIVETNVPIKGSVPHMREDVVRLKDINRTADLRYRAEFSEWELTFTVEYLASAMKTADVINLFNTGGFTSGLGEWRPEKGGEFGRYIIKGH